MFEVALKKSMAGPTKRPKKPAQHDSGEEYESDESGSYNGPQVSQSFEVMAPLKHVKLTP